MSTQNKATAKVIKDLALQKIELLKQKKITASNTPVDKDLDFKLVVVNSLLYIVGMLNSDSKAINNQLTN